MDPQPPQQFDLRSQQPPPASAPGEPSDPRQQVIERLKGSVNVLVTVSANPSVDQLAAAIGFTLVLNKLKKHGTTVFSGQTPAAIDFLQPDKTIEKNTDSLRDFIVALDKSKADKLRYKVEDKFVKIFITPYHTSLSEHDLEFGQGDFNVDVIIALGVNKREELDQSITAHGRILHDATVVSITKDAGDNMGSINWHVPGASSFSEILVGLSDSLKSPQTELFDEQIATAFLTGIVSETDRFSNDKTTPQTMSMAGILMKAGANQQLIATKLEEPEPIPEVAETPPPPAPSPEPPAPEPPAPVAPAAPPPPPPPPAAPTDGSLQIAHEEPAANQPAVSPIPPPSDDIHIDDEGTLHKFGEDSPAEDSQQSSTDDSSSLNPPQAGIPLLSHDNTSSTSVDHDDQTLEEIEKAVNSPHLQDKPDENAVSPVISEEEARKKVEAAEDASPAPRAALGTTPVDLDLGHDDQPGDTPSTPPMYGSTPPPATPPPII